MTEYTKDDVSEYVESQMDCKVLSSKPETTINDLGHEVTIWNVKTDNEGSWWVATDGNLPMNLYPQDKPYYFATDEVFSFHLGLMMRVMYDHETQPQQVIKLEWEKSVHQTAYEYLKFKEMDDVVSILKKSSLNLSESTDTWLDGDRVLVGWHLYLKVPMDIKKYYDRNVEEEISEAYGEALGADNYLRDIHIEIKKVEDSKAYSFYSDGEYLEIGPKYDYDVVLSFAGEDRNYVEKVANRLLYNRIRVFYDNFETVDNWGKDLYTHFDEIYRKKSRYCVMFLSKKYADKVWTNHERRSAQARAFEERKEYILPVRFDETDIPGIIPTVGYIDANQYNPEDLAEMIIKKVGNYK